MITLDHAQEIQTQRKMTERFVELLNLARQYSYDPDSMRPYLEYGEAVICNDNQIWDGDHLSMIQVRQLTIKLPGDGLHLVTRRRTQDRSSILVARFKAEVESRANLQSHELLLSTSAQFSADSLLDNGLPDTIDMTIDIDRHRLENA